MEISALDNPPVIQALALAKRFGRTHAVRECNMTLPMGSLCALLGPNGSGKTTLLRLLLGMLRADAGRSVVLGKPSSQLLGESFQRIGYVAEGQDYPQTLTGRQLLRWCRRIYARWDEDFCQRLVRDFDVPLDTTLGSCSRGQRMKILLISSIAFRPRLLVLDEPFSGLDPVHREDFGQALLGIAEVGEWSMLISSHDVDDIERLVDRVAIIRDGCIAIEADLDELKSRFRRVEGRLTQAGVTPKAPIPQTWFQWMQSGRRVNFVDSAFDAEVCNEKLSAIFGEPVPLESLGLSLKEIYIAFSRKNEVVS